MPKLSYTYTDPTSFTSGSGQTPYGTYDSDETFQSDILSVTKWTARRLGHPVLQLEIPSSSIYACFEESISEYSQHINNYNMKNWMWEQYGEKKRISGSMDTDVLNPITPALGPSVTLSEKYGQLVNMEENFDLKKGHITLSGSQQDYNLQTLWANVSESSRRIEVQRVFNQAPAAVSRFYDPYAGSFDQRQLLDAFGFGNVSPAVSFVLKPISYDLARANAIETSDLIRKSAYSFEIHNNNLRIFPKPQSTDTGEKIYFEYYVKQDIRNTNNENAEMTGGISDPSNVPYQFITYNSINAPGRQWIRKYTAALTKELLGIIRSKYSSMPIPDADVTLDGDSLKAEGREEKTQLLEELKEFLESVSLTEKLKAEAEEVNAQQEVLNKAPLPIFVG
tara:strand:- start:43 stop:1224 length:1182 start_codon:yes stop_codon:yes gene_type:complete